MEAWRGFPSIILRFLRLGKYVFEKSGDKVLERVLERRDYKYIMEVGVPGVEAPRLPLRASRGHMRPRASR